MGTSEICNSYGDEYGDGCHVVCDVMRYGKFLLSLQRSLLFDQARWSIMIRKTEVSLAIMVHTFWATRRDTPGKWADWTWCLRENLCP